MIRSERIQDTLHKVAEFGAAPEGGTTRLSYSKEFLGAQEYLRQEMLKIGMEVEVDPIGNLVGTYVGTDGTLVPVMSGSHLDTVPLGGNFDGILGAVAALEVARSWHEEGYTPKRSLQVIATIEEEGTSFGMACFGVSVRCGEFAHKQPQDIPCAVNDGTLADCLANAGLKQDALQKTAEEKLPAAFVELHIEQGAELDEQGLPAGIVTSIVGFDRLHLVIKGESNHAGTTAMHRRKDAVAAGAAIALGVQALARKDKRFVATVGSFTVEPNVPNIVPGKVSLCVETRSYTDEILQEVREMVMHVVEKAVADNNVEYEIEGDYHNFAMPMDEKIIDTMVDSAAELQLNAVKMPSWAGHDSQIFAKAGVPTGMIFVPSINGVSHAKEELSRPEEITRGVELLESVLRKLTAK